MSNQNNAGTTVLMTGNEAAARGALEAGVRFCTSYPGSPAVEVADVLFSAKDVYGEWSTNEIIAFEAAAAASYAGLRAITVMKHNGLAVAADFLLSLNHAALKSGLVVVIGDDPSGHSSVNELDSRQFVRFAEVPLLEPSTIEEAREMTRYAFELSEQVGTFVIVRLVTRICHARGNVVLREIPDFPAVKPSIGKEERFRCRPPLHVDVHVRQEKAREIYEHSPFNSYSGPQSETVIVSSGPSVLYAREALQILGLEDKVGLLKLGASWPVPREFVLKTAGHAENIIFIEDIDPFIEQNIITVLAQFGGKRYKFFGQGSGHVKGEWGAGMGEMNPDQAVQALCNVFDLPNPLKAPAVPTPDGVLKEELPVRELTMCPGCPHRSSFWAIKTALELDGRDGFPLGDIGCYAMGARKASNFLLRSVFCMGSGAGMANGFGQLQNMGFDQPVIATVGDSTFFHACLPALVNARYNNADFTLVVLDNSTTAMTGFQPHAGTATPGKDSKSIMMIEDVTRGMGLETVVCDPHQLDDTVENLCRLLKKKGANVLIMRKPCALMNYRLEQRLFEVDSEKCLGDDCGCSRFCSRVFACPAIFFDESIGKAYINDTLCTGCGACATLCPRGAIYEKSFSGTEGKN
ncbi:MAG: 4Fe-4S binding protein [Dethiobacter sp.]|jgi:indolepyruvate ferredoxin oxidoreductase alpha subunit|nr:4Fe-4S binding protein [Dethiobacter sp.]